MLTKMLATLGKLDEYTRSVQILASTPNPVDGAGLVSWDLSRFLKNPVILWAHDNTKIPIGKASEVEFVPGVGLKMRVHFASERANKCAEEIFQCVKEEIVRAVSVGFTPGESTTNADGTVLLSANILNEVSFVPVGADEDAGTPALNPEAVSEDEKMARSVSEAARALARHRQRKRAAASAMKFDKEDIVRFDRSLFARSLERFRETSIGGRVIPARLSRTGVLTYRLPDGSTRRELRHPDEVFHPDSLRTLEDVPVIDITDHTQIHGPDDYRKVAVGHLKTFRHDATFIEGDLAIQDGATLDAIGRGERHEISLGYRCRLDMTAGVYNGEPYDCVQRDIRYNHVALCPPNRGRAGPEVSLRFDNQPSQWGVSDAPDGEQEPLMKIIRLDGKDFTFGSEEHIAKIEQLHESTIAVVRTDAKTALDKAHADLTAANGALATEKKRADEAAARADEAKAQLDKFTADAKGRADKEDEEYKRKRTARRHLERIISRFFGDDDEDEEDDDDDKMDAKEEKLNEMLDKSSDRELMLHAIKKVHPHFDEKDKSDDYVKSRFDSVVETVSKKKTVTDVANHARQELSRLDATDPDNPNDPVIKARKDRDEAARNAWKGGK